MHNQSIIPSDLDLARQRVLKQARRIISLSSQNDMMHVPYWLLVEISKLGQRITAYDEELDEQATR